MRRWVRRLQAQPLIVNTKTGESFRGVLVGTHGPYLELAVAELLGQGEPRKLDGSVFIDRADVKFMQAP